MDYRNFRILIVDDNLSFIRAFMLIIRNVLGSRLEQIEVAINGEEAVEKIKDQYFDFIFMDINMPKMNGIEATKQINRECNRFTKIVGISFNNDFQTLNEMIHSGASIYVNKANLTFEEVRKILYS